MTHRLPRVLFLEGTAMAAGAVDLASSAGAGVTVAGQRRIFTGFAATLPFVYSIVSGA